MTATLSLPEGVEIRGALGDRYEQILTHDALAFIAGLQRRFNGTVKALLARRAERNAAIRSGETPIDFAPETEAIREGDWTVAPVPDAIADRRVEITGPVDRKMIINALNSGANVFMADFEDASSPTWANMVEGQINLYDAVRREIRFEDPVKNKKYELKDEIATLFVRARGLHLLEKHIVVDGEPMRGALMDFGLFFFHNAKEQIARGAGPFFYLPKLESYEEARWWNQVFYTAQTQLGVPVGSIKATVLIETLPGAFQMNEILYELREHSAGLNCGRWDYIFSFIKTLAHDPNCVLPDRSQVGMTRAFLKAYSEQLIKICHRRGAHAMGGMAAQIPIRGDEEANAAAFEKVKADKVREAKEGHDGTWVAHPGLIPTAKAAFDEYMPEPNQIARQRDDIDHGRDAMIEVHTGTRTEEGLRLNIRVGIQYIEAWLRGNGCVPLYNLMEDAATAEISRTQVWQWVKYGAALDNGSVITLDMVKTMIGEELDRVRGEIGAERFDAGKFDAASKLFEQLVTAEELTEFLTLPAYEQLLASEG